MVKEREASDWEKNAIREEFEKAVARNATAAEIDQIRRDIAELLGLSYAQVKAIGAWKREENGLVLKPTQVAGEVNKNDIEEMLDSSESAANRNTKTNENTSLSNALSAIGSSADPTTHEEVLHSAPAPDLATSGHAISFHPQSGAWTDYEHSAIKGVWRYAEADMIDQCVDKSPEVRANMRIICTPGIKCYLEVRHLLALGFRGENIIAVERERKAWRDFEENARELGIKPIFGDLKDLLPTMHGPFDIACIDFVGAGSVDNLQIVEMLPLAPRAIVSINVMAKREKTEFQEAMGRLHKTAASDQPQVGRDTMRAGLDKLLHEARQGKKLPTREINRCIVDLVSQGYKNLETHFANDNDMSWEERETMLWYIQRYAGTGKTSTWMNASMIDDLKITANDFSHSDQLKKCSQDKLNQMYVTNEYRELMKFFNAFAMQMIGLVDDPRIFHVQFMADLLNCVTCRRRQIVALKKYRYNSQVGQTPSPFCTSIAVTEVPSREYQKYHPLIYFMQKAMAVIRKQPASREFPIARQTTTRGMVANQTLWSGLNFSVMDGNRKVTSMNFENMLAMLGEYFDRFIPQYPLSQWENQNKLPWERLEDVIEQRKQKSGFITDFTLNGI